MDAQILLWLQEVLRNAVLDPIFIVYTSLGNAGVLYILSAAVMLCFPKTRKAGALALGAMALGFLCTNVTLKHLFERPRPWLEIEGLKFLVEEGDPNSFPSGHTCAAFAAAGVWVRALPVRWGKVLAVLSAVLMGFSRLYVGVHYPSDVLVGMCIGILCSQVVWYLWKWAEPRLRQH